jgi:hypothetical protein
VGRQTWVETLIAAEIGGPSVGTLGTSSCLPPAARVAIPSNFFDVGMALRIQATGQVTTAAFGSGGTGEFFVTLGGNTVFDSLPIAFGTNLGGPGRNFLLDILLTCRTIGPASFMGQGTWINSVGPGSNGPALGQTIDLLPWNSPPAVGGTFDSTFAAQLDLLFAKTVGTGTLLINEYTVQAIN